MVRKSPQEESSPSLNQEGSKKQSISMSVNRLRYEAYDAPRPAPRLAIRRNSNRSLESSSSGRSSNRTGSTSSHDRLSGSVNQLTGPEEIGGEDLARTLTAGDLALAAHDPNFGRALSSNILHSNEVRHLGSTVDIAFTNGLWVAC